MAAERPPRRPHLTEKARREAEERRQRLSAALRENLKKRKQQARVRNKPASSREDDG